MFRRMLVPGLMAVAVLLASGCKPTIPTGVACASSYSKCNSSPLGRVEAQALSRRSRPSLIKSGDGRATEGKGGPFSCW